MPYTKLLLDNCSLMNGEIVRELRLALAKLLSNCLVIKNEFPSATEYISVIQFGEEVKCLLPFTDDYSLILNTINNMQPKGL